MSSFFWRGPHPYPQKIRPWLHALGAIHRHETKSKTPPCPPWLRFWNEGPTLDPTPGNIDVSRPELKGGVEACGTRALANLDVIHVYLDTFAV